MILTKQKTSIIIKVLKDHNFIVRSEKVPVKTKEVIYKLPFLLINELNKQVAIFICWGKYRKGFFYLMEDVCSVIKRCTSYKTVPFIFGSNLELKVLKIAKQKFIPVLNYVEGIYRFYKNE